MSFGSMYIGSTGIKAHSVLMQQIGSNIANVNTTAYKSGDTFLENLKSQSVFGTNSGIVNGGANTPGQLGLGARISTTRINMKEGAFQTSSSSTDLAIGGQGFFRVVNPATSAIHYTRAGHFLFDKQGNLVDSHKNILQGFQIDQNGVISDTSTNIRLPMKPEKDSTGKEILVVKSDPKATSSVTMRTNLDSGAVDNSSNNKNPFFSMLSEWNGKNDPPLGVDKYAYHSTIQVYDSNGKKHNLVTYYDKVTNSKSDVGDKSHWEYVVAVPPGEDGSALGGTSGSGLLMTGTLTFAGDGTLVAQSAYTLANGTNASGVKNLNNWELAKLNSNGSPTFDVTFSGAEKQNIAFDMGIKSESQSWNMQGSTAASIGSNASNIPNMANSKINALATTNYYGSATTISQSQDGYTEGYLQNVSVDKDGILKGLFSNGEVEKLYKINLYNFKNEYGLKREGSNYFAESAASGKAIQGIAGKEGLGSIAGSNLETSNVDLAAEFGKMILTQRGFQANSKSITTAESLINTALGIKR